jgi:hypothetical protein
MGAGVAELGRGNAATATEQSSLPAYWNPATLPFLRRSEASLGADVRALQRNGGYASYQGRLTGNLGAGFAVVNRGDYDLPAYDADENKLGTARPQFFGYYLGFGLKTSRQNSLGLSLHGYTSALDIDGVTGDVNVIGLVNLAWYHRLSDALSVGLSLRNLGLNSDLNAEFDQITLGDETEFGFERTTSDFLPKTLIVGAEYRFIWKGRAFTVAAEAMDYQLQPDLFALDFEQHAQAGRIGGEWEAAKGVVLRAGLDRLNPTLGFGYTYLLKKRPLRFDYAVTLERGWTTFNPYAVGLRVTL